MDFQNKNEISNGPVYRYLGADLRGSISRIHKLLQTRSLNHMPQTVLCLKNDKYRVFHINGPKVKWNCILKSYCIQLFLVFFLDHIYMNEQIFVLDHIYIYINEQIFKLDLDQMSTYICRHLI